MNPPVPDTTRCRPSRVHNLDTDRLERRYAYLLANRDRLAAACDGRTPLRSLAAELYTLDAELGRRGVAHPPLL